MRGQNFLLDRGSGGFLVPGLTGEMEGVRQIATTRAAVEQVIGKLPVIDGLLPERLRLNALPRRAKNEPGLC